MCGWYSRNDSANTLQRTRAAFPSIANGVAASPLALLAYVPGSCVGDIVEAEELHR